VNKYLRQSSEAFPGLDHECRRELLGPWPRFYMIISVNSFSNPIDPRFFRSYDVKRGLDDGVMEYEQGVVIKFLTDQFIDHHKIHTRLSAQFSEQTYTLRTIKF
jgi:hypothetical protein